MRQQNKKSRRDPIIMNVNKLAQNVSRSQLKNQSKYNQIRQFNPDFEFKLYKPSIPTFDSRQQISLAQDIMLKQIDKLMEQQQKLNIQLDRCRIKHRQQQKKIQKQIMHNMDHYTFLRKLWKKDQAVQRTDNKVDKLIHNIGSIKGHILNLIKRQSHLSESPAQIHELIVSSPQYCTLQKQYEQLKFQYEIKVLHEKQETNNTSQSSIDSEDTRKINDLQAEVAKLNLQLVNKNKQLQRIKFLYKINGKDKKSTSNNLDNAILQNNNNETQINRNNQLLFSYLIKASDDSYVINIQEMTRSSGSIQNVVPQNQEVRQIVSNQSLQNIIKFIESNPVRRVTKASLNNIQQKQPEQQIKKFTVQDITKAKFISSRQSIPAKNQDIIQN